MGKDNITRDANIHIRARNADLSRIDEAAQQLGESRSEFLLEGGRERADKVLRDQTVFELPADRWAAFMVELERPPADNPGLRDLFSRRAPWEA
jgi:uncharacterized protein (DUF1778 family)